MKNFITILLFAVIIGCSKKEPFTKEMWKITNGDTPYQNREQVIDDLIDNHLKVGMKVSELVNLIGKPDQIGSFEPNKYYYIYKEEYPFMDIDPILYKLEISFSEDSITVTGIKKIER